MITTLVQFQLPSPISLAEATALRVERAEIPEYRRAHPQVLHPLRGRPRCRRHLSLGDARGRRAGLRRRMARTGGKALRRQARDHMVRQPRGRR